MSTDSGHSQEGTQEHPETPTVEIDGQQVSLEELKKGYLRQSDYTRKMQEISQMRKDPDPDDQGDFAKDLDTLVEVLAPKLQERFVTRQDNELEKFISANPDLEGKRKLLEDLGKASNKSYWDIADEYGLKESEALEKAKSRKIVGKKDIEPKKPRSLMDLSPEEYAQWKKDNLGRSEQWSSKKAI